MATKNLWTEYDGKGFAAEYSEYADRASRDENGHVITDAYIKSPAQVPTDFDDFNTDVSTTNVTVTNAGSTHTNPPKSDSRTFVVITTVGASTDNQTQIAIGIDGNRHAGLFYRCKSSGTWEAWLQVLNERPVSIPKGSSTKGIYVDADGHPVACDYGLSIGTAVADSSILSVL